MLFMIIAPLAAFAGFGALCATTRRQMRAIWKTPPSPAKRRLVRIAGWLTLALALAPCVAWWGSGGARWTQSMGIIAWACLLPIMALALTFLFVFARRAVIWGAAVAGGIAWALSLVWAVSAVV